MSYYIKKKQGFLSLTDIGVADFFLGGTGLGLKLHLSSASKLDRANFFKCNNVNVSISNLSIRLKQSRHKLLFGIVKPILLSVMKPVITKVLAKQIQDSFAKMDAIAYKIHTEQQKVKKDMANDPENAPNIYRRYALAFRAEMMKKKGKAQRVAINKEVKVAVTKEDSLDCFKNISLPGGISTKATEYRDLARQGDKWQSDVFSLGNAAESRNIPQPQGISRKSPHAHRVNTKDRPADTSTTYSETSRASKDSGYHGIDPVVLNAGSGPGYSNLEEGKMGTIPYETQGKSDLTKPHGVMC